MTPSLLFVIMNNKERDLIMPTTQNEIAQWLDKLYTDENLTHMIVFCDTYDYSDYPVYVSKEQDVRSRAKASNMQKVMEVYSRNYTKELQLSQRRAFNYD